MTATAPLTYPLIIAEIKRLAAEGFGIEDIAFKLDLNWRDVRPFIFGKKP